MGKLNLRYIKQTIAASLSVFATFLPFNFAFANKANITYSKDTSVLPLAAKVKNKRIASTSAGELYFMSIYEPHTDLACYSTQFHFNENSKYSGQKLSAIQCHDREPSKGLNFDIDGALKIKGIERIASGIDQLSLQFGKYTHCDAQLKIESNGDVTAMSINCKLALHKI